LLIAQRPLLSAADPVFGGHDKQMLVSAAVASSHGGLIAAPTHIVPYFTTQAQYSLPNTVFLLPGRQNVALGMNVGFGEHAGWNWSDFYELLFLISEDAFLYRTENWYYGLGMGVGMQLNYNDRINSLLIFQFKLLAGVKISEKTNIEFYFQHFSNGHVSEINVPYNFYGASVVFKF
jgi:hypothetical protein